MLKIPAATEWGVLMFLSVFDLGDGVVRLQDGVVADDGECADIILDLEPGQRYGGYSHEGLLTLVGRRIEVPKRERARLTG
jgi:hypothetical protein